ncbi:glycohydrolase toxin TNT-related protein [Mycobacterium paraense]
MDHIPAGLRLDRVGPNGGAFMSAEGAPLGSRATPPGLASQYHTMSGSGRTVPDNWVVRHGPAKPAFGQPGGAEQWVVIDRITKQTVSVEELDLAGIITGLTR